MQKNKYSEKDISVVIPTYNRAPELKITLNALKPFLKSLGEVVVVDQSTSNESKKVVLKFKSKKIKYIFSKTPSITIARNLGVKKSSKKTKIICFIDDDVSPHDSYFKEILKVYQEIPSAKAAAGYVPHESSIDKENAIEQLARRIFLLGGRLKANDSSIVSSYGNRYPKKITGVIKADWFPGDNMSFKKKIFEKIQCDENLLGYTVAEDIDISYRVSQIFPNSVFITPHAKITHRYSPQARYPTARLAYLNQVDHFYFNFKNLNRNLYEKLAFAWSLTGITALRILQLAKTRKEEDALKLKFYFSSLFYCVKNLESIRQGNVRDFELHLKTHHTKT